VVFSDFIVLSDSYSMNTLYLASEITNSDGSIVASDKLTFVHSYEHNANSGKTSMTIDVTAKTLQDPFFETTFAVNLYRTVARKFITGLN
jgi:hypothetical protein